MNQLPRQDGKKASLIGRGKLPMLFSRSQTGLEHITEYNKVANSFIINKAKKFTDDIENTIKLKKLDSEESDHYYDSNWDEYHKLGSFFPEVIRYSVLVAICTHFESTLTDICKTIDTDIYKDNHLRDSKRFRGAVIHHPYKEIRQEKGIRKPKHYFKKNMSIDFVSHKKWQTLIETFEIRNCIVHTNGDYLLMSKPEDIVKIVEKNKNIEIVISKISISDSYINDTSKFMIDFIRCLQLACKENDILGPAYWR